MANLWIVLRVVILSFGRFTFHIPQGCRFVDYPDCRSDVPVLRGLDLNIKPGQYVVLIDSSGCGKSTTVGFIERFYDPVGGQVLVYGISVLEYNLAEYRKSMSIVSQESTYTASA
jgi:ABC-type multidrug transport system fused ATPase/permease subunit